MKKNTVKIVLDVILFFALALLYNKRALGMSFHEIGGLAVCGLFIIHKVLNWNWIRSVTTRLFQTSTPAKTRFCYGIDALLFCCFAFIALSGVLISKTILTSISGGGRLWKVGHYFAAALALVLTGVHVGLHWGFIKGMLFKKICLPRLLARAVSAVLLVLVLGYGGYSLATGGFVGWLSGPFVSVSAEGRGQGGEGRHQNGPNGEGGARRGEGEADGAFVGKPDGAFAGKPGGEGGAGQALGTLAEYGSILGAVAVVTAAADGLLHRRKRTAS